MAYSSAHLRKTNWDLGGKVGGSVYCYDTADAVATVYAIGYITDAWAKGMRKGDLVIYRKWTTAPPAADSEVLTAAGTANVFLGHTLMSVIGISTAGAADLTDGTLVTVTNT